MRSSAPVNTAAQAAASATPAPAPPLAAAGAGLYPPRDKQTRKLWDALCKFRKAATRGARGDATELELAAPSSYTRACAYSYCERLGLDARKVEKEVDSRIQTSVVVALKPDSSPVDSPDASRKRKAESPPDETGGPEAAANALAASAAVASSAPVPALPSVAARRQLMKELHACAAKSDAAGALAVFDRMTAEGLAPQEAECSVLLHLCAASDPPRASEAERIWEAARAAGATLKEPSWSCFIRVLCAAGDLDRAQAVLDEMQRGGGCGRLRLRTVSPLLAAAAERGDVALGDAACARLAAAGLALGEAEYVQLVRLHAVRGDAEGVEGVLCRMAGEVSAVTDAGMRDLKLAVERGEAVEGGAGDGETVEGGAGDAEGVEGVLSRMAREVSAVTDAGMGELKAAVERGVGGGDVMEGEAVEGGAVGGEGDVAGRVVESAAKPDEGMPEQGGQANGDGAEPVGGDIGHCPPPFSRPTLGTWGWRASFAQVDRSGRCSVTGVQLRREAVDATERAQLCSAVERLASGAKDFTAFTRWVAQQPPWDFVLDGANIGFFGQGRHLNLMKVQARQQQQEDKKERERAAAGGVAGTGGGREADQGDSRAAESGSSRAVGGVNGTGAAPAAMAAASAGSCIPPDASRVRDQTDRSRAEREREEVFDLSHVESVLRNMQQVRPGAPTQRVLLILHEKHTTGRSNTDQALIEQWRAEGVLCTTPRKQNDDLYWLYAALASGDGCSVVSNDQMRDHSFGMLAPRAFVRWRERHVVRFCFREWSSQPTVEFPKPYSATMQRDAATGAWHVPSAESSGAWLCLRRGEWGEGSGGQA